MEQKYNFFCKKSISLESDFQNVINAYLNFTKAKIVFLFNCLCLLIAIIFACSFGLRTITITKKN